jgi:hypothetical protein
MAPPVSQTVPYWDRERGGYFVEWLAKERRFVGARA